MVSLVGMSRRYIHGGGWGDHLPRTLAKGINPILLKNNVEPRILRILFLDYTK